MDNKKFSKKLQQLRKANNMTQQELANKLHVSNKTISKWENSRGFPDITLVPELAKTLGVSIDELLNDYQLYQKKNMTKMKLLLFVVAILMIFICLGIINRQKEGMVFDIASLKDTTFMESDSFVGANCYIEIKSEESLQYAMQKNKRSTNTGTLVDPGGDYSINRHYDKSLQKALLLDSWKLFDETKDKDKGKTVNEIASMTIYLSKREIDQESGAMDVPYSLRIYVQQCLDGYMISLLTFDNSMSSDTSGTSIYFIEDDIFSQITQNIKAL